MLTIHSLTQCPCHVCTCKFCLLFVYLTCVLYIRLEYIRFSSRFVELSFRVSFRASHFVSRFALSFRTSRFVELSFRVSFRYGCGSRRGIELTFKPSELDE